ncbi:MAG: tetratricopeptide repeat protein [Thermoplasmata archaeon]|nr:tetratricopeptide repeat protein [Thermoplasmata archaeon]
MRPALQSDAASGDPYACLALAYFMQTGKEMDMDIPQAITWYERAASLGCARAHWELTRIYLEGEFVTRDEAVASQHLIRSAELGNADAQMYLGDEYMSGGLVPRDEAEALKWYTRSAEQGVSVAKFTVGYMYAHGIGTKRSDTEAEIWFSSAGITGEAEMFMDIGMCYEYGLNGIVHNEVEAARWYKYGVDMGHEKCILCWNSVMESLGGAPREPMEDRLDRLSMTEAQREVNERAGALATADELFDDGLMEEAFESYDHAARLGSPEAMFAKAMMLHQGIGVERDDINAIKELSHAANAGSEDAQFYLARTYESSKFPTDDSQIVKLYSDAAYNGFLAAYYYLSKYVDHPEIYARRTHTRR